MSVGGRRGGLSKGAILEDGDIKMGNLQRGGKGGHGGAEEERQGGM